MYYCVEMADKEIPRVDDAINLFTDEEQEICEQVFKAITERRLPDAVHARLDAHDHDYLHELSRQIGRFWIDFRRDKRDFSTFRRDYRDATFSGDNVVKKELFDLLKRYFVETKEWVAEEIKVVDMGDHEVERNLTQQQTLGDEKGSHDSIDTGPNPGNPLHNSTPPDGKAGGWGKK